MFSLDIVEMALDLPQTSVHYPLCVLDRVSEGGFEEGLGGREKVVTSIGNFLNLIN